MLGWGRPQIQGPRDSPRMPVSHHCPQAVAGCKSAKAPSQASPAQHILTSLLLLTGQLLQLGLSLQQLHNTLLAAQLHPAALLERRPPHCPH